FQIVQCIQCGLVHQNPRPKREFLSQIYPENYEPLISLEGKNRKEREERIGQQISRYRLVKQVHRYPGTLLDVGSGAGDFIYLAQKHGWNVYGIEINEDAYQYQKKLGLKVHNRELTEAGFDDAFFDVVTLWDTFEHISEPVGTLNEIHRILKRDGAVIMSLPNFESFERRLFGKVWFAIDAPRHLYHYSPSTIKQMLKKTGFGAERVMFATTATAFINSARFVMKRDKKSPIYRTDTGQIRAASEEREDDISFKGRLKKLIFSSVLTPFLNMLDRVHTGGHIIVIVRKEEYLRQHQQRL
ncbi:MAG: class I SAM-dependent methyltransferase, partial [bacterium]